MSRWIASAYRPPAWLRSPHVQSALSSSALRRRSGERHFAETCPVTTEHWLTTPEGVRLQGFHSRPSGYRPEAGLALLLHGWEGSASSSYMLHTAATLLRAGMAVFRLNFRDHGATHHANEGIFHSCRLQEVLDAAVQIQQRFDADRMVVAGYSLGGNFALRLALKGPTVGLALAHAAAVCPVLDPAAGMTALERGPWIYQWYFLRKWRASLRRKRALFPELHRYDDAALERGMRSLTDWLVREQTQFGTLEDYFSGYAVAGDRLLAAPVPLSILTSEDDPVIPVAGFHALTLPDSAYLEIAEHGGHCAFLEGVDLSGYAERWVAARLLGAVGSGTAATMVDPQFATS